MIAALLDEQLAKTKNQLLLRERTRPAAFLDTEQRPDASRVGLICLEDLNTVLIDPVQNAHWDDNAPLLGGCPSVPSGEGQKSFFNRANVLVLQRGNEAVQGFAKQHRVHAFQ